MRTMPGPEAFISMSGTLASAVSGAIAAAQGVHTTPARICTFSRVMSSCARRFATSGLGPVSSRRTISSVTPGGSSD